MALDDLTQTLYRELRRLAQARLMRLRPGQTLQPTELVHEVYMRLANKPGWESREQFFGVAACAMRDIMVEHVRHKLRLKRGGDQERVYIPDDMTLGPPDDRRVMAVEEILALHHALERLEESLPENAKLVRLRYFAGLTLEEIAELCGESKSTVERRWRFTRAWLKARLQEQQTTRSE